MFHNFLFLQSDMDLAYLEYLMPFPVRKVARLQCFFCYIVNEGQ